MKPITNKVLHGDFLDVDFGKAEFDLIIADPPYGIGKDFGNGSDTLEFNEFMEFNRQWLDKAMALLSEKGLIYIYGFAEILARVSALLPMENQRWLTWYYKNKVVPQSLFWQRSSEHIICAWHNKPKLDVDAIREPYSISHLKNVGGVRTASKTSRLGSEASLFKDNGGALPRDVLAINTLAGTCGRKERFFWCRTCKHPYPIIVQHAHDKCGASAKVIHPTQKPRELCRRLIRSLKTDKPILVPFAGSGAECITARSLGKDFVATEINDEYVDMANTIIERGYWKYES